MGEVFWGVIEQTIGAWNFLALAVLAVLFYTLFRFLRGVQGGSRFHRSLRSAADRAHDGYERRLRSWLSTIERLIAPRVAQAGETFSFEPKARDEDDLMRVMADPWGWPVLSVAMRVGVVYPLLFAMGFWALSDDTVGLGSFEIFPDRLEQIWRFVGFGVLIFCIVVPMLTSANLLGVFERHEKWLDGFAISSGVVGAVAGVVVVVITGGGAVVGALAGAVLVAGPGAVVVAVASAVALAFAVAGIGILAFVVALTVGGLVVVVGLSVATKAARQGYGRLAHVGLIVIALASCFAALRLSTSLDVYAQLFLLSLVLLPLINALFDWGSYGATIALLQTGLVDRPNKAQRRVLLALADVVIAFIAFFFLATALIFALEFVNAGQAQDLVDVRLILETPGEHIWVIAMVASTLLPTALHLLFIGLPSLVLWAPPALWVRMVDGLSLEGDTDGRVSVLAAAALSAMIVATLAGLLAALYGVFWIAWHGSAHVLAFYLDLLFPVQAFAAQLFS